MSAQQTIGNQAAVTPVLPIKVGDMVIVTSGDHRFLTAKIIGLAGRYTGHTDYVCLRYVGERRWFFAPPHDEWRYVGDIAVITEMPKGE